MPRHHFRHISISDTCDLMTLKAIEAIARYIACKGNYDKDGSRRLSATYDDFTAYKLRDNVTL